MSYSRPGLYPYPKEFKSLEDANKYAKDMYAALLEKDSRADYMKDRSTDKDLKELIVRPEWYGAKGDGVTDDTAAIQAAIDIGQTSGIPVLFGPGTYITSGIVIKDSITTAIKTSRLRGSGSNITTIKLKASANADVITQTNFDTLAAGVDPYGLWNLQIEDLTIDGNKSNNLTAGCGIQVYGWCTEFRNIVVQNCREDGIVTQWGNDRTGSDTDTKMEGYFSNIVSMNNVGNGWTFRGPHDFIIVGYTGKGNTGWGFKNDSVAAGGLGNGSGGHCFNFNLWNNTSGGAWIVTALSIFDLSASASGTAVLIDTNAGPTQLTSCWIAGQGASGVGIEVKSSSVQMQGIYLTNGTVGLKMNGMGGCVFSGRIDTTTTGILVTSDGGDNFITATIIDPAGGTAVSGTFATNDYILIRTDGITSTQTVQFPAGSNVATLTSSQIFSGTKTFSALYSDFHNGSNGYVRIVPGDNANAPGYIEFRKGDDTRLAWIGQSTTNFPLGLENGADFEILGGSVDIDATESYKVNGVQVIGVQQAAVADATDNASAILRLNELLARVRTHGIIAT